MASSSRLTIAWPRRHASLIISSIGRLYSRHGRGKARPVGTNARKIFVKVVVAGPPIAGIEARRRPCRTSNPRFAPAHVTGRQLVSPGPFVPERRAARAVRSFSARSPAVRGGSVSRVTSLAAGELGRHTKAGAESWNGARSAAAGMPSRLLLRSLEPEIADAQAQPASGLLTPNAQSVVRHSTTRKPRANPSVHDSSPQAAARRAADCQVAAWRRLAAAPIVRGRACPPRDTSHSG